LLARRAPGAFNQALMELGARICTPRRPECTACPVCRWCAARGTDAQHDLPVRRSKRPSPQVEVAVALVRRGGRLLLVRRPATGLLANLWTLPGGEVCDGQPHEPQLRLRVKETAGIDVRVGRRLETLRHTFSHRRWRVHIYTAYVARAAAAPKRRPDVCWVTPSKLADYPLATLDRKLLGAAAQNSRFEI
jgi:A/G-specific adenine glycosylase